MSRLPIVVLIFSIFLLAGTSVLATFTSASEENLKTTSSPAPGSGAGDESSSAVQGAIGVEGIVEETSRAAYTGELEVLRRHAAPELVDHYDGPKAFDARVGETLQSAPEVPSGNARVLEAGPANLFDEAVIYRVAVEDHEDVQHVLGLVLKEAPRKASTEITYCYMYVENEHLGEPGEESGLWRDLVGNEDMCLPQETEDKELEDGFSVSVNGRPENDAL